MKKFFLILVVVLAVAAAAAFVFQEPLKRVVIDSITSDMFVAEDNDSFDPGPAIGTMLPAVVASANGESVTDVLQYGGPKGTVFVVSRSVDW